jgi:SH3-like domain-containing protein
MQKKQPNITSAKLMLLYLSKDPVLKSMLRFDPIVLLNYGFVVFHNIKKTIEILSRFCQASFLYKTKNVLINLLATALVLFSTRSFAYEQNVPRFATIKSNQVNARFGPGTTYPIDWVFVSKGEPIKIIAEFEQWRKIQDVEGKGGWAHSSVLSPKRSVVIMGNNIQKLLAQNDPAARVVAKIEPGLRCLFDKCKEKWCKIKCDGYKGWIEAVNIWGVLQGEEG